MNQHTVFRRNFLMQGLSTASPVLEFGPLDKPLLNKNSSKVFYIDYTDLANLQKIYANEKDVVVENICSPDFILNGLSLAKLTEGKKFQGIVASHVIEHVPNIIDWLKETANLLDDSGILNLAIPDKRFCFDSHRALSTATDMIGAFLNNEKKPTPRMIFDQNAYYIEQDTYGIWRNGARPIKNPDARLKYALEQAQLCLNTDQYMNVHCWVFTPESFLHCIHSLIEMDLFDFEIAFFEPTAIGQGEFFISLKKLSVTLSIEAKKQRQRESLFAIGFRSNGLAQPLNINRRIDRKSRVLFLAQSILKKCRGHFFKPH